MQPTVASGLPNEITAIVTTILGLTQPLLITTYIAITLTDTVLVVIVVDPALDVSTSSNVSVASSTT